MMKALALGVAAIVATLGGSYAASMLSAARTSGGKAEERPAVDIVKLEPQSVPIIRGGAVEGYVIARISVSALASDVKSSKPVIAAFAGEAAFRTIYEEKAFDFKALKAAEVARLAEEIAKLANGRIGRQAIREAIVESLNFVSSSEVRAQQGR